MAHESGHIEFDDDFLQELLGEFPRAVFGSAVDRFGPSRRQRTFFDTQFDDIMRSFEGESVRAIQEGRSPQSFEQRLEEPNFFRRLLLSTSPVARGNQSTRLLAPTVSFIPNVR